MEIVIEPPAKSVIYNKGHEHTWDVQHSEEHVIHVHSRGRENVI